MSLEGLTTINIELTDVCNKNCWMCGRRKREKENPEIIHNYGFMDFSLIKKIAKQLPSNIIVQFHNNGEGLLYPKFGDAVKLFPNQIKNVVTNGKLLLEKYDEIVDNLDSISISVFENDSESEEQYEIVKKFLKKKGDKKPFVVIRANGEVDVERYKRLGLPIAKRVLHAPEGSFNYVKRNPTIPEHGVCLDFLSHLAINRKGDVSICVRYDPKGLGILGNVRYNTLEEIWNSQQRMEWLNFHKTNQRKRIPLCSFCEYYGVPTQ